MNKQQTNQQKMETDYLWIKNYNKNADGMGLGRNHGQYFIYNHVVNSRQRIQMAYRSLGKQYDWELEKYRSKKKTIDRGNKLRFAKNILRFFKHPAAYVFWKTFRLRSYSGELAIRVVLFFMIFTIYNYKEIEQIKTQKNRYMLTIGQNVQGRPGFFTGYYNKQKYPIKLTMVQLKQSLMHPKLIVASPAHKQTLRKQLSLFKAYNVQF